MTLPSRVSAHPNRVSSPLLGDDPLALPHRGHSMDLAASHCGPLATTSLELNASTAEPQENHSRAEGAEAWPVLSLFSGAGGFDLGFKQAGFKPGLAVDIDPAAVETYRWNEPDTHVALLDIAESSPDELVKLWTSINGDNGPVGIIGGPALSGVLSFKCVPEKRRPQAQAS